MFLRRLEILEASIEKQTTGIKTFDPLVHMIGIDTATNNPATTHQDADADGSIEDFGSADADVTNDSGGSDVTEVMADLDDSTADR